jgi:uncharacterized protein
LQSSVHFYSAGVRCAAVLWLPEGASASSQVPGIVMCHGFRGIKEWFLPPTAEAFRRGGFAVLTIDYRGFGESDGEQRGRLVPLEQVEDIRAALSFLGAQAEVDPERLALWGTSFGGANVVQAAAVDGRVKAVVSQVPLGDVRRAWWEPLPQARKTWWNTLFEEDRVRRTTTGEYGVIDPGEILNNPQSQASFAEAKRLFPRLASTFPLEAIERVFEFCPEQVAHQISPRPLLIIGARNDLAVPPEEAQFLFARALEPKRLEWMNITHYQIYESPHREQADALALAWFGQHL